MFFKKKQIEIGKKYFIGRTEYEILYYDEEQKIILTKDEGDNLIFIFLSENYKIKDGCIIAKGNKMSFTITESEMLECINTYFSLRTDEEVAEESIISAIRNKHYKISTPLAKIIAKWYML